MNSTFTLIRGIVREITPMGLRKSQLNCACCTSIKNWFTFVNSEFSTNYGIQVKPRWPSWSTLGRPLARMLETRMPTQGTQLGNVKPSINRTVYVYDEKLSFWKMLNRLYSYSRYWIGASLHLRLMRVMTPSAFNDILPHDPPFHTSSSPISRTRIWPFALSFSNMFVAHMESVCPISILKYFRFLMCVEVSDRLIYFQMRHTFQR